jgi:hypothetical protein
VPIGKYYKGHGSEVMKSMVEQYGEKKGKQVFYAKANKEGLGPKSGQGRMIKKKLAARSED